MAGVASSTYGTGALVSPCHRISHLPIYSSDSPAREEFPFLAPLLSEPALAGAMKQRNGRDILWAGIYQAGVAFANLESFVERVAGELQLDRLPFDVGPALERLDPLINSYTSCSPPLTRRQVTRLVLAEDLRRIRDALKSGGPSSDLDPNTQLQEFLPKYIDLLANLGLHADGPQLYVVDRLPFPYTEMPWEALCFDAADASTHGSPPGLYFLSSKLEPWYSAYVLAHELIHVIVGRVNPHLLARGLEEGICELLGVMYLSREVLGTNLTRNIYRLTILGSATDTFWELYLDYTRQAFFLYRRFGLAGLVSLLLAGRDAIKEMERRLAVAPDEVTLPSGNWDAATSSLCDELLLTRIRHLIVSPLAWYAAQRVAPGDSIQSLAAKCSIPTALAEEALAELQDKIFSVVTADGRVEYSDAAWLVEAGELRYEPEADSGSA